jgi:hypothetical protein
VALDRFDHPLTQFSIMAEGIDRRLGSRAQAQT